MSAQADVSEAVERPPAAVDVLAFFERAPAQAGVREEFKRAIRELLGHHAAIKFKAWGLGAKDGEKILVDLAEQAADCVLLEIAIRESATGVSIEPQTFSAYVVLFEDRQEFRDVVLSCIGAAAFDAGLATEKDET